MNADTLIYVMTAAVVVSAAAIVLQTILLIGMASAARATKNQVTSLAAKVEPLIAKVEPMAETAQDLLRQARTSFTEVSAKTNELLEVTRKQLGRVDELMGEATVRTRAQMDRIEMVLDDTVNRFQETTTLLQNGVMKPLRHLAGLTAAIRTGVGAFFGGQRATVEQATHDEEMFI